MVATSTCLGRPSTVVYRAVCARWRRACSGGVPSAGGKERVASLLRAAGERRRHCTGSPACLRMDLRFRVGLDLGFRAHKGPLVHSTSLRSSSSTVTVNWSSPQRWSVPVPFTLSQTNIEFPKAPSKTAKVWTGTVNVSSPGARSLPPFLRVRGEERAGISQNGLLAEHAGRPLGNDLRLIDGPRPRVR